MENLKVLVEFDNKKEPLNCFYNNSFYLQRELNSSYQIQFVAFNDGSISYQMLEVLGSIWFQGQEFIIKQIVPDFNGGIEQKQITAIHVMYECSSFRQNSIKTGVITYTPQSLMDYVFNNNPNNHKFTFEVIGDFDSQQIQDFGNVSGQDTLSKIIEVWPGTVIDADNYHLKIYSKEKFEFNLGNRIDYLHDTNEIQLTYDATSLTNKVLCIGKAQDNPEGADDNTPTTYYFEPFIFSIDDSINKYGEKWAELISDDRFTNPESMKQYAISKLQPEPALSITANRISNEPASLGEIVRLEIRSADLVTNVEIVSSTWYPFDDSQPTQITLNNTAKTILDYQSNIMHRIGRVNEQNKARINAITLDLVSLDSRTRQDINQINTTIVDNNKTQNSRISNVENDNKTNSKNIESLKNGVDGYKAQVIDVVNDLKNNANEIKTKASQKELDQVKKDVSEVVSAASSANRLATVANGKADKAQKAVDNLTNVVNSKASQDDLKSTDEKIENLSNDISAFNLGLSNKANKSDLYNFATNTDLEKLQEQINKINGPRITYKEV